MNFSKKGTIEKQRLIQSTSKKVANKVRITSLRISIIVVIALIVVGSIAGYGAWKGIIDSAPSIDDIDVVPSRYATFIYDNDGNQIQRLVGSSANRVYVTNDQIPDCVKESFIAIEDERFYEHNGIDVQGMFRALFNGLASGEFDQGASTLTQQLLKNQVFEGGNESSFIAKLQRKVQEQYLAIQLEDRISKDQILEYYLNTINLGANTLGVQAASQRYFNKSVSELTISEAAVIAGITKSPTNLNPITYPDNNRVRRQNVLDKMLEQEFISQEEYVEAIEDTDNVYERIQDVNASIVNSSSYNSYFVDELIDQVVSDLQEKLGYTSTQATNLIYTGGLKIYTTQDSELQSICDSVIENPSYYPSDSVLELEYRLSVMHEDGTEEHFSEATLKQYFNEKATAENGYSTNAFNAYFDSEEDAKPYIEEYRKHVVKDTDTVIGETTNFKPQPQVSFTLMDQSTGEVKALVGGRGTKNGNRTLNRATDTTRQPGSTFKVLSTYLPALDTAGLTLADVQDDAPYTYPGTNRKVTNWNKSYAGLSSLRAAITNSMNIVTVKTLNQITPQLGFDYLQKLGFTTLVDQREASDGSIQSDINLSLALGGITDGITNLELTAAYAAIANAGVYNKPIFYTRIEDSSGKVLIENKSQSTQVMKESTAWLLTDAMKDVVTKGTGKLCQLSKSSIPVAGKTGTTNSDIDLWFSGYTPYYTATIWGGYDYGEDQVNTTYHKKIWKAIMDQIHDNLKVKDFVKPDSITSARICSKCGKLAVDGLCDKAVGGSTVKTEYFAKGTVPTEKCTCHYKVSICTTSGKLATDFCPKDQIKEVVYLDKEETSSTPDSKLMLPSTILNSSCTIHTHLSPIPEKPIQDELPDVDAEYDSNQDEESDTTEDSTILDELNQIGNSTE